jgi:hypothetical protein
VDRRAVVDLFAIRCAVAVLVHVRHHLDRLDRSWIRRVDAAVGQLADASGQLHGDLAAAARQLLDPAIDPGGQRTVRAIDRLAALMHVNQTSAPALAASLRLAGPPVQPTLFDTDGDTDPVQEPA